MKILSYNIMSGGFNGYDHEAKQPQRLELIKKVIKEISADVVSLIDTFRWDEIYTNQELCKMFGYKHAHCINLNDDRLKELGHNNGITVLSNIEGTKFETTSLGTRDCIHTLLQSNKYTLNIFSVYLDDLKEDVRLSQINQLEKHLKDQNKTIIVGDLNTFSPKNINDSKSKIDGFFSKNPQYLALKNQFYDMLNAKVISKLFDLGFKDASTDDISTAPTKLTGLTSEALLRLDFCLYKNLNIKNFQVLTDKIYDKVSDHYPILIEV